MTTIWPSVAIGAFAAATLFCAGCQRRVISDDQVDEGTRVPRRAVAIPTRRWKISVRSDQQSILPCQPLYVAVVITNESEQKLELRDLMRYSRVQIIAAPKGAGEKAVSSWTQMEAERFALIVPDNDKIVLPRNSVTMDCLLSADTSNSKWAEMERPARLFEQPGDYELYAAVVNVFASSPIEVQRSAPLRLVVREPAPNEREYVQFFEKGRQIPPIYANFTGADVGIIQALTELIEKNPDSPIADDARDFLMHHLIRAAELPNDMGYDLKGLGAAAEQYLAISPERRQLRRRSIKRWLSLAGEFHIDDAKPVFDVMASWKGSSPFYEEDVDAQAALDRKIAELEARFAQEARQKAAADRSKSKPLPTN
ncbi:MAG TPA: hypothetical protein VMP01_14355 [Pirellulaceae bacterium]|nr:hypothetical protein [Pirellulaceae bacterium]